MNPNGAVTREQFFVMFARALNISSESTLNKTFADASQISNYASGAINALVNHGYVNGLTATQLGPKNNIDRASVASLLAQTCVGYVTSDGTVTADKAGIVINLASNVTVTGSADVTVVAAKEGAKVDFDSYTGSATVIALKSNAAVTNAPGGTTVLAAANATGVTANGVSVAAGGSFSNPSAFIDQTQTTVTTGGSSSSGSSYTPSTPTTSTAESIVVKEETTVGYTEATQTYNDIMITDDVGEGVVTLQNLYIEGTLTINGGGSESIHLVDCTFGPNGKIVMGKTGGNPPRLVLDNTPVQQVEAKTPAIIESDGSEIQNVVAKDNVTVQGESTKINTVSVASGDNNKTVSLTLKGASVDNVAADTPVAVSADSQKGGSVEL
jgi:hypothetical protein